MSGELSSVARLRGSQRFYCLSLRLLLRKIHRLGGRLGRRFCVAEVSTGHPRPRQKEVSVVPIFILFKDPYKPQFVAMFTIHIRSCRDEPPGPSADFVEFRTVEDARPYVLNCKLCYIKTRRSPTLLHYYFLLITFGIYPDNPQFITLEFRDGQPVPYKKNLHFVLVGDAFRIPQNSTKSAGR